jgi:colanic acid/amylovoran biosynthesis glycosyltransferase
MHIKLVVNSFPIVSETFLFNLVVGLQAKGYHVTVCAQTHTNNIQYYTARLHEWTGEIDVMPYAANGVKKWLNLFPYFIGQIGTFFSKDRQTLKRNILSKIQVANLLKGNPDIIHFAYSGIAVSLMDSIPELKSNGIKIVTSCRGSAEKVRPIVEPTRKDELRKLFSLCDKVHCVSEDMMKGLKKYGLEEQNTFVNYPSVDVEYFKREKPYVIKQNQKIKIVTTGRLHFQKGYVYSLQAMKMLKDAGYDYEYKIIGDGPDKHMIQYLISELQLEEHVLLTGKISLTEVKQILLDSDIFVLPSLYEGIANAALEAMALQLPLVTTRSGGMAEVITHRENGMLVERFDGRLIFEAVKELIDHPDVRKKISDNSNIVIKKIFNTKNQIDKYHTFYHALMK